MNAIAHPTPAEATRGTPLAGKYMTFRVGGEEYVRHIHGSTLAHATIWA